MENFLPLFKADQATRTVWARAAAEEPDKAREIMDYVTARPQFEAWSNGFAKATMGKSLGNIRAMHNHKHLAGKVQEIVYDDTGKNVDICIKVLDPVDWVKVEEGGYTGLSIGGGYANKWPCPLHKGLTRYTPRISEISLVDAPCIPSARFLELHKRDGSVQEVMLKGVPRTFNELLPPPTFEEMLEKGRFSAVGPTLGRIAGGTRDIVDRAVNHPVTSTLRGAVKVGKTVKDVSSLATLGAGATGIFAVSHHHHQPDNIKKPRYMRKSVGSALGEIGARAAKFAGAYAKTGRSVLGAGRSALGRTRVGTAAGKVASQVAAHPRVAAAGREVAATGWKGAIAPLHTIARAGGAAVGGARGADIAGRIGLAGDYAPVAYTAGKLTGVIPDKKPAEKMAKAEVDAAKAKIATTMHEWKAGKLRSYRGVNAKGKPRRGPKVTDQRQAIAIALSQARREGLGKGLLSSGLKVAGSLAERVGASKAGQAVGRTLASSGVRHIAKEAAFEAGGAAAVGGVGYGAWQGAKAIGNAISPSKPAMKKPGYMTKADDIADIIAERMEKGIGSALGAGLATGAAVGAGYGALRGRKPANKHSVLGHVGIGALWGGAPYVGYRVGRALVAKDPGDLAKPAHMKKAEAFAAAIADEMAKRTLHEDVRASARGTALLGGVTGAALGGVGGAMIGAAGGSFVGAAAGAHEHYRQKRIATAKAANAPRTVHRILSDSQHAQRIAAAKARWMREGHHDLDDHFAARTASAKTAWLGSTKKVAAIKQERDAAWHGVADTHEAYDKVRPHIPPHANLMMYVKGHGGLLHNPEGVGDFDNETYVLHPHEADDFIKKHGKNAQAAEKRAPQGLLSPAAFADVRVNVEGRFVRLPQDEPEAAAA